MQSDGSSSAPQGPSKSQAVALLIGQAEYLALCVELHQKLVALDQSQPYLPVCVSSDPACRDSLTSRMQGPPTLPIPCKQA